MYLSDRQSHANCTRVTASRKQISANLSMLHATGSHSGTNYMRLAASRMQILHVLAASCVQSRNLFASTLREQLFE
jgi:hypothetical protein